MWPRRPKVETLLFEWMYLKNGSLINECVKRVLSISFHTRDRLAGEPIMEAKFLRPEMAFGWAKLANPSNGSRFGPQNIEIF